MCPTSDERNASTPSWLAFELYFYIGLIYVLYPGYITKTGQFNPVKHLQL